MRRNAKIFFIVAGILLLAGLLLVGYACTLPVYTDPKAPFRISQALQDFPANTKFSEWYRQLRAYETPHKRLFD